MAKGEIVAGSTDQTIDIFVPDSSSTTGAGLTGLMFNTASLTCYYRKGATGTPTALPLATQTVGGDHSDGGFVAVDGTNCPGQYRLDLSDTIVATAGRVYLYLKGATNMAPVLVEIEVVAVNKFDATRFGLSALPNAAAAAAGGLLTFGNGTGQIDPNSGAVPISGDLTTTMKASVNAEADQALADVGLTTTITGRIDAAITTRMATFTYTTPPTAAANATAVRAELATELARIDVGISTRLASAGYTAPLDAAGTRSAVGLASANLDTQIATLATAASLVTVNNNVIAVGNTVTALNNVSTAQVQSSCAAALTAYDPATGTEAAAIQSATDAVKVVTDALTAAAAAKLQKSTATMVVGTVTNAGLTPTTTQFEASDITEATADHYKDLVIKFITGALAGQGTSISAYSLNTGRGRFTVTAMTEAPANGDTFIVI